MISWRLTGLSALGTHFISLSTESLMPTVPRLKNWKETKFTNMGLNKCTHTNVNGAAKPWQQFLKVCLMGFLWGFPFSFATQYMQHLWTPNGFPALNTLNILMKDYLILQESKNRPNVFCCEHFVETKWGKGWGLKGGKKSIQWWKGKECKNSDILWRITFSPLRGP